MRSTHTTHVAWMPTGVPLAIAIIMAGSVVALTDQTWSWPVGSAALAVLLLVWGAIIWWLADFAQRSRPHWQCTHCRYDLRGLRAGACCPECGSHRQPPKHA